MEKYLCFIPLAFVGAVLLWQVVVFVYERRNGDLDDRN